MSYELADLSRYEQIHYLAKRWQGPLHVFLSTMLLHLYTERSLRERVFAILEEVMPDRASGKGQANRQTGRPGIEQWKILVLGVLRLGLNVDYDRVQGLANQHKTIRQMLGQSDWLDEHCYELQTIRKNVSLFTLEIRDRINEEVVHTGHQALKKTLKKA